VSVRLFAPLPGRPLRRAELAAVAALALAGSLWMLWSHAWQVTLNDYGLEAMRPLVALLHARIWLFLSTAPAYGPSLVLRAPFALGASLAHGTELLVYRLSALPCLLALAGLAVWIAPQLRAAGRGWLAILLTLAVCVLNPVTYFALAIGHPEEILGAVLCVAAVVAALRGHANWAGFLLGVAIANKEWAVVAIGPVLVALPGQRIRALLVATGVGGVLLGPLALASGTLASAGARLTVSDGASNFYTQQLWWFFGTPAHWTLQTHDQVMLGFRFPPAWLAGHAHILIASIGLPLSYFATRRRMPRENALALLALLMLLRCGLDPWDLVYYQLPFIAALLSWETVVKGRAPVGAAIATAAAYAIFEQLPYHLSADQQALAFTIPCLVALLVLSATVYRFPLVPRSTSMHSARTCASAPVTSIRSAIRMPGTPSG